MKMKKDQTIKVYKGNAEQPFLIIETNSCGHKVSFTLKDKEKHVDVTLEHCEDAAILIMKQMINQFDISIWRLFTAKVKWWMKKLCNVAVALF